MKHPSLAAIIPALAFLTLSACERKQPNPPENPAMPDQLRPENIPGGSGSAAGSSGGGSSGGPSSGGSGVPDRQPAPGSGP